jgi:hypothetical protein
MEQLEPGLQRLDQPLTACLNDPQDLRRRVLDAIELDPKALSREHHNFEHDPGAQNCEQDAGEQAPASPVSGPRKVDRFADGDLIPPHRHEKSKAICAVDELRAYSARLPHRRQSPGRVV